MARVQASVEFNESDWSAADRELAKLEQTVRGPAIGTAMRKVASDINKQTKAILPKPGYPGDKPELIPLRETLKIKTKNYQGGTVKVVITGYSYPAGAHGHLLEGGHDLVKGGEKGSGGQVVGQVQPYEYLIHVVLSTKSQQGQTLVNSIRKILAKRS